jgi:hypothetical protein
VYNLCTLEKSEEIIEKTTSSEELFIQDPLASQFQDAFGDLQTPVILHMILMMLFLHVQVT